MAKLGLRRYETQIRIFFILLVFVLLIINVMNFYLLSSSRKTLVDSEMKRGKVLSEAVFREIQQSGATEILGGSGRLEFPVYSSYLRRSAGKHGLASLSILNLQGNVVVSSDSYDPLQRDDDLAKLEEMSLRSLKSGIGVNSPHDGGRIVYFSPVPSSEGKINGFVKSVYFDLSLEREEKNYRILISSQAAVVVIVLILVIIFGSWVVKPFRAIGELASKLPDEIKKEWGWTNEPILVEESFKRVLNKIIEQEEVLKKIHMDTESLAGSAEAFIEKVAKEMASGVIYLDDRSRVITMNPESARIAGVDLGEVRGKPILPYVSHIEGLSVLLEKAMKEGRRYSREMLGFLSKEGRKGHLGVAITPVRGDAGNVIGALCMLTDLTEIQSLQERGRLRENLAAVGAVSAGIAHEFRNSLGAILAYAKLIMKGSAADDPRENAMAILKEVESSRRIVDDFLLYTRPAQLNRIRFDLKRMLEELKEDVESSKQLSNLSLEIMGDTVEIFADELLLKQAFFNVIKNASEAYEGRAGKVSIEIERLPDKRIRVSFTDHAGGVPDEKIDKIFIPFFSTKKSGTGLGLALTQKIVVSHDGMIEAENRQGEGLTLKINLPARIQ